MEKNLVTMVMAALLSAMSCFGQGQYQAGNIYGLFMAADGSKYWVKNQPPSAGPNMVTDTGFPITMASNGSKLSTTSSTGALILDSAGVLSHVTRRQIPSTGTIFLAYSTLKGGPTGTLSIRNIVPSVGSATFNVDMQYYSTVDPVAVRTQCQSGGSGWAFGATPFPAFSGGTVVCTVNSYWDGASIITPLTTGLTYKLVCRATSSTTATANLGVNVVDATVFVGL